MFFFSSATALVAAAGANAWIERTRAGRDSLAIHLSHPMWLKLAFVDLAERDTSAEWLTAVAAITLAASLEPIGAVNG